MKNILKNLHFLKLLSLSNKKSILALINTAKNDQLYTIFECMHNLLLGNVKFGQKDFKKMKKFKHLIRKLANKNTTIKEKRNILIKKYSLIKLILPLIFEKIKNEVC